MVYDCFTFFNELDFLEIRLNILDSVVDKFVLVEASRNHQGLEKPLYFQENKQRFEKFLPKIIHIVVDTYPENPEGNAWVLERYQRNCIARGLSSCKPDDVILISDVDEVPRPEKILAFKNKPGIKVFCQDMYYYFVNCINATSLGSSRKYCWMGTVMFNYKDIKKSIQEFRDQNIRMQALNHLNPVLRMYWKFRIGWEILTSNPRITLVKDGGWHFSYLGGVDRIISKLEAFAHAEYNTKDFKDPKKIEEAINQGNDIFGRSFRYHFIDLDSSFPNWLLQNIDKYPQFVKKTQSSN